MLDINYNIMIQHLETKADISEIPNGCELRDMASYFRKLSVFTLKDGHSIILKDNNEILVPEKIWWDLHMQKIIADHKEY